MSLTLLLEKYDVSSEEGLKKALNDIEKEEAEVDEALSGVLSRACTLEGRLCTASQAYTKLGELEHDAQEASNMIDKTATLARDVSAKVRQLDLARSRVAECQRRVHDLIDLQLCSAGVEAALKAHDYETAAGHVSRFLSMSPASVAAARARGERDPQQQMDAHAQTLRDHLVRKFDEAAKKEDDAGVERIYKLFSQIGRTSEGMELLAKYLAKQAEVSISRACVVESARSEAAVFADAVTRVAEAGAAALTRAPALLPHALTRIQPVICAGVKRVYSDLVRVRQLEMETWRGKDPRSLEVALGELALVHSTIRLYFNFLRRKIQAEVSVLKEEEKQSKIDAIEDIITNCELTRTAQDVLGLYLTLERYFLEESVNKALKMASVQDVTSNFVDDVFFIARKVISRSMCSGSVEGVCCVLNECGGAVESRLAAALRRALAAPPPHALLLPLPGAAPPPPPSHASQDDAFFTYLSYAECGAEWAERLATEAVREAEMRRVCETPREREKLNSCAAGLATAAATLRSIPPAALSPLRAALRPQALAAAALLVSPNTEVGEGIEDDAAVVPAALEALAETMRTRMSERAADALLVAVVTDIVTRAENRILHYTYDKEGGLAVERRVRRFISWVGGEAGAARERCMTLQQMAALLASDSTEVVASPRLPPNTVRQVLARRSDFKIEDIKRLVL